ncbi:MAG TPA: GFA family protein [Rhizomicrobium sp.]|nr:GFA family protein [Rhizomicrobium sp.]
MKIDGGCHCGAISFEAEVDPAKVAVCHCTDCQQISGAPYRASVPALAEKLTLRGEPKHYVKTADSGNKRLHGFCGECGSAIYATTPTDQRVFNLRVGAIRQRAELVPKIQGFCRSAMPWVWDIAAIPKAPDERLAVKKS